MLLLWLGCGSLTIAQEQGSPAELKIAEVGEDRQPPMFETDIRPLLKTHCFHCHGEQGEQEGGLDVRLRRLLVEGGDTGPAIVPGDSQASYLLDRLFHGEMPPGEGKQLPENDILLIERWVVAGAPTLRPEPETIGEEMLITPEDRQFWAFQPITRPALPAVRDLTRIRTPIDRFVLAKLEAQGLTFSADADQETLIRRVSFDLRGLPPTAAEIETFLNDTSSTAYEKMVDRMLASPHYGEQWGRHWLDIAGYADSEGHAQDDDRPWAYRYRDYVIRALNEDKPLDQFVVEQLAGDELAGPQEGDWTAEQIRLLEATGLLRMAADGTGRVNDLTHREQVVTDTIEILSSSLLGLTVQCARCHDHRYDPISQVDYYRLRAIFEPALHPAQWQTPAQRRVSLATQAERKRAAEIDQAAAAIRAERAKKQAEFITAALEEELQKFDEPLREQLRTAYRTPAAERTETQQQLLKQHPSVNITPGVLYQYNPDAAEALKQYDQRINAVLAKKPPELFVRALRESNAKPDALPLTHLFHRGEPTQPKQAVAPGGLTITGPETQPFSIAANAAAVPSTGRRLAFARWLTSPQHPTFARVMANRIWLGHFGRGLIPTPADLGRLGEQPTHPELLDWLAVELRERGWSLKEIHRLICHSTVYRQTARGIPAFAKDAPRESSRPGEAAAAQQRLEHALEIDPANRFYWKWPLRRLSAEMLRDALLFASGELDLALYGPAVPLTKDEAGQVLVAEGQHRRSVYVQVKRTQPVALLELFDQPQMVTNCPRRQNSTAAPQALVMLNSQRIQQRAAAIAAAIVKVPATADELAALDAARSPPLSSFRPGRWELGYGTRTAPETTPAEQRVTNFQLLPHRNGLVAQGGESLPHKELGWVMLRPQGGHPGEGLEYTAIRRWHAPAAGTLTIEGKLQHGSDKGDGVRAAIIASRSGQQGEWIAHQGESDTSVATFHVQAGETIDFVVDCRSGTGFDSFTWTCSLRFQEAGQSIQDAGQTWPWVTHTTAAFAPQQKSLELPTQVAIERLWQRVLQRSPHSDERKLAENFLREQMKQLAKQRKSREPGDALLALRHLTQALLSSNELLYIE